MSSLFLIDTLLKSLEKTIQFDLYYTLYNITSPLITCLISKKCINDELLSNLNFCIFFTNHTISTTKEIINEFKIDKSILSFLLQKYAITNENSTYWQWQIFSFTVIQWLYFNNQKNRI